MLGIRYDQSTIHLMKDLKSVVQYAIIKLFLLNRLLLLARSRNEQERDMVHTVRLCPETIILRGSEDVTIVSDNSLIPIPSYFGILTLTHIANILPPPNNFVILNNRRPTFSTLSFKVLLAS